MIIFSEKQNVRRQKERKKVSIVYQDEQQKQKFNKQTYEESKVESRQHHKKGERGKRGRRGRREGREGEKV